MLLRDSKIIFAGTAALKERKQSTSVNKLYCYTSVSVIVQVESVMGDKDLRAACLLTCSLLICVFPSCASLHSNKAVSPEKPLDRRGWEWCLRQVFKSTFGVVWLCPQNPKTWPFYPLAPWTTCAIFQQNRFIRFQNIVFTRLVTDERPDGWTDKSRTLYLPHYRLAGGIKIPTHALFLRQSHISHPDEYWSFSCRRWLVDIRAHLLTSSDDSSSHQVKCQTTTPP